VVQTYGSESPVIAQEEKKPRIETTPSTTPLKLSPTNNLAKSTTTPVKFSTTNNLSRSPTAFSPKSPTSYITLKTLPAPLTNTSALGGGQVIKLLTSSPPLTIPAQSMASTSVAGTQPTLILTAGSTPGSQHIIPSGTLNGLPMFTIVGTQTSTTQGPQQFVALSQSKLATSAQSVSTTLAGAVPVLFTPVHYPPNSLDGSSGAKSMATSLIATSVTGNNVVIMSSAVGVSHVSNSGANCVNSALKQKLASKIAYKLPKGQLLEAKSLHGLDKSVPNGLYPVTPPRTPPEQKSLSETQQSDAGSQTHEELDVCKKNCNLCL